MYAPGRAASIKMHAQYPSLPEPLTRLVTFCPRFECPIVTARAGVIPKNATAVTGVARYGVGLADRLFDCAGKACKWMFLKTRRR
jgi:hypothetical protein